MNSKVIREPLGDRMVLFCIYSMLVFVLVLILYPLIYIVSSSFSSPKAVTLGQVWLLPIHLSLDGYKAILNYPMILRGYANSAIYTLLGTIISVVLTIMLSYPLSRRNFQGRNFLMIVLIITMMFEGGIIPLYLTVKSVGILNSMWAMLLPSAIVVWQVIVARTFFQMNIPDELVEAADMDGCSDIGFLLRIVVPLSQPIIATLALMYAVQQWNSYFDALIYLKSPSLYPLQIVLREIIIVNQVDLNVLDVMDSAGRQELTNQMKYPLIVLASAPVLLIFPFVQRFFVQGMLVGSVKG